jgi:hypothetical protein
MRSYQVVEFGHTLRGAAPRSHALPARSRGRSGRSAKDGLPPYRGVASESVSAVFGTIAICSTTQQAVRSRQSRRTAPAVGAR